MQLKRLQFENFRNYDSLDLELSAPVTALVGLNAQGKTNVLEGIVFMALGKSFRTNRALDTLKWDKPHGRIKAELEHEGETTQLELFMQKAPELKKMKKNDKIIPAREFLGKLRVVIFTPDHAELIAGGPALRRQFLDRLLVQTDPSYVEDLAKYHRVLQHRNALLKRLAFGNNQAGEWDLWDQKLLEAAGVIWDRRGVALNFFKKNLEAAYQKIANKEDELKLSFDSSKEMAEELLAAHHERDLAQGFTSVGPHRDDFLLSINGKHLAETGSRGESRSAVLALKLCELNFLEEQTGQKPLLLLDDVFSELDEKRQAALSELMTNHQCILTTNTLHPAQNHEGYRIFRVEKGLIFS